MAMKGDDLYEERTEPIKGTDNATWWWLKRDTGAWTGPIADWNESHYDAFVKDIAPKKVVVTAGGNMGLYTRAYSEMFERVYVFEPDHFNFSALVRNNLAHNVFFFRAALGAKAGWCTLDPSNDQCNVGMHKVRQDSGGIIPVMCIDDLKLDHCNLIQLDVEGYEPEVISGAMETIKRCDPVVVTEGNHGKVRTLLASIGYESHNSASRADFIYRRKQNV
jgi:FkbM family methyltransferase